MLGRIRLLACILAGGSILVGPLALATVDDLVSLTARGGGTFLVRCRDSSEMTVNAEQIRRDDVCGGRPRFGEKFSSEQSASLDEGRYCTASGWAETDARASEKVRHDAKLRCLIDESWSRFEELDVACSQDCREFQGTFSICTGWFRCRND